MSKIQIFEGLKTLLATVVATKGDNTTMSYKFIGIWRNLIEREKIENPKLFPACFIEFLPSNYMELSSGVQSYDLTVRLHCCFESYKDEDLDVLRLVDKTYQVVQGKQYGNAGKLKRRNEEQDFDHDNVQDYIQDYFVGKVKDYGSDNRPTTEATVVPVIIPVLTPTPPPIEYSYLTKENEEFILLENGFKILI